MNFKKRSLRLFIVFLLAALLVMLPVTAQAQETGPQIRITQVDNSKFPQVTVYISVTDAAGEPMAVDPGQIRITENGKDMQSTDAGGPERIGTLTTLLVMDVSGSMLDAGKLKGAKQAAKAYVKQMRPGDQTGLVTFNTVVRYVQPLTTDLETLTAAIDQLNAYENTAMYDALAKSTEILQDVSGRKAIIVLTDGLDNISKNTAETVIKSIGPIGLSISTIGLGDPKKSGQNSGLDEAGLKKFSAETGGIYSYANDPETLQSLYTLYARALQSEYSIIYTSPATLRDGANRTLSVSLSQAGINTSSSAHIEYNPGGVLPEVANSPSWSIFAAILAGLLILLFVPQLAGLFFRQQTSQVRADAPAKKANIKLK